jgi:hypothetical protein
VRKQPEAKKPDREPVPQEVVSRVPEWSEDEESVAGLAAVISPRLLPEAFPESQVIQLQEVRQ